MASSDFIIRTSEYRTCIVNGKNALFHRWADNLMVKPSDEGAIKLATIGIVELEDGTVNCCYPDEIRFTDNKFSEYCFEMPPTNKCKGFGVPVTGSENAV